MKIQLKYHNSILQDELFFPRPIHVLSLKPIENIPTETELILTALANPVDKPLLEHILRRGEKTTLVVPDQTRYCNLGKCLPLLIEQIISAGIKKHDLTILIANGTHTPASVPEKIELLGNDIYQNFNVIDHDCHDKDNLIHLGETHRGTPLFINKHIVKAERLILVGAVRPHYFAGFGGGAKLINPGCAGLETILQNHKLTINPDNPDLHPGCRVGNVNGNPVFEDIHDSMKFLQTDFSLQLVLDSQEQIIAAYAGSLESSFQQACEKAAEIYFVPIQQQSDLVIASCGGYPHDINLIQAHKTLQHAAYAVKDGGVIIFCAGCTQGIGSKTFEEWFEYPTSNLMHDAILKNFKINSNTALSLKIKTERLKILFMSNLAPQLIKKFGLIETHSLKEALSQATTFLPNNFSTTIITDGALTVPVQVIP